MPTEDDTINCPEECPQVFTRILMEIKYLRKDTERLYSKVEASEKFRWLLTGGAGLLSLLAIVISILSSVK